jgi:hypothetical protein
MIGLVALDFILRIVFGSTVGVAFVVEIMSMDHPDRSTHPTSFRIPRDVVTNFESFSHLCSSVRPGRERGSHKLGYGLLALNVALRVCGIIHLTLQHSSQEENR